MQSANLGKNVNSKTTESTDASGSILGPLFLILSVASILGIFLWKLHVNQPESNSNNTQIDVPKTYAGNVLRQVENKSAILVLTKIGIVARALENHNEVNVIDGTVEEAAWDPFYDILWIIVNHTLTAIDFREEHLSQKIIAERMPKVQIRIWPPHGKFDGGILSENWENNSDKKSIGLVWNSASPELVGEYPFGYCMAESDDEDVHASVKKASRLLAKRARLIAIDWLKDLTHRTLNKNVFINGFSNHLELHPKSTSCDGWSGCGGSLECNSYAPFGSDGSKLFVVSSICGDYCSVACFLKRPNGMFQSPIGQPDKTTISTGVNPSVGEPCGNYYFDHTNNSYIIGNQTCNSDGNCNEQDGTVLGWIDPGVIIEGAGSNKLR